MIKSISYDEQEIIQSILNLHCEGDIELDPTYSKGNFYKGFIKEPTLKFDLHPQKPGVVLSNAEHLPVEDGCITTMMFDPPFLATTGSSLEKMDRSNILNKRFGVYPNELSLHLFYKNALIEFYRILKKDGILIFKCQDKVSSGIQYLSHVFIINAAVEIGFYCKDMFVLLAKNRIVADWQLKNQKNARKFHSYFLVFQKCKKQVRYS